MCQLEQPRRAGCACPEGIGFCSLLGTPLKLLPNQRAAISRVARPSVRCRVPRS